MKHGHDGLAPKFMPARGSELTDPKSGKVIRDAVDSVQNINVDRLEWLLAHRRIHAHHHQAGRLLQRDWELAEIATYSTIDGVGGGGGLNRLPDAKLDAMTRMGRAREYVGPMAWSIIDLVVLQGVSLNKAEAHLRMSQKSGIGALTVALDALARFYNLA